LGFEPEAGAAALALSPDARGVDLKVIRYSLKNFGCDRSEIHRFKSTVRWSRTMASAASGRKSSRALELHVILPLR
jgi:hypothetical protein